MKHKVVLMSGVATVLLLSGVGMKTRENDPTPNQEKMSYEEKSEILIEIPTNLRVSQGDEKSLLQSITLHHDKKLQPSLVVEGINWEKTGQQMITVKAWDKHGNRGERNAVIDIMENQKPIIKTKDLVISKGDTFNLWDEVEARDKEDGNLTKSLEISGDVDVQTPGEYIISYQVTDSFKQKTSEKRKIVVKDSQEDENELIVQSNETVEKMGNPGTEEQVSTNVFLSEPKESATPKTSPNSDYSPLTLYVLGTAIPYQNGGQGNGQGIIDGNPYGVASTWGGAELQSGSDGLNSHFIGHNPGVFHLLFSLETGNQVTITDGNGTPTVYTVSSIFQVDDYAVGIADGQEYWDLITGTGGGERVTFQVCINDTTNLIVIAYA